MNHGVIAASRLGDWLMGVLPDLEYSPLAALSPERAPLLAPIGDSLIQTVTFDSAGPAPLVDPTITVNLPQGFLFDGMVGGEGECEGECQVGQTPLVGADGTLTWQLNEII